MLQYGVGPIGASIVRLMRQKAALEIVGAIDKDPAKAGRDLGEVAGATDAPWGVTVAADSTPATRKAGRRGDPLDVVISTERDGPTARMPRRGLLRCFHMRGTRLSLSQASRSFRAT